MIRIFGIRHHGPGSARAVRRELHAWQPDAVVVELPADAQELACWIGHADLRPPVAILVYNPKDFSQAAFFPMAHFSPEWQALRYARQRELPTYFMDLPMGIAFCLGAEHRQLPPVGKCEGEDPDLRDDPIGYLARLAGYADGERWWEATFESREYGSEAFGLIAEMMRALRQEREACETQHRRMREAWMRRTLRRVRKEGYARIAVVCGAWHVPALEALPQLPARADDALLKGLKKVKTRATWVPWTWSRLTLQSGYGAGIASPAWYDLLFRHREHATTRWMVRAVRLMREKGWDASAAHALEAVRLAEALAAMRALALPGIEELKEAALAVVCEGRALRLQLIEQALVVGHKTGRIPREVPQTPLVADLLRCIKKARLTKYWGEPQAHTLVLDLRKPANLEASRLLHRLAVMGIEWGELRAEGAARKGAFSETWRMCWQPELTLQLIEASIWGNTVAEAAEQALWHRARQTDTLPELASLVTQALLADLRGVWGRLVPRLREAAALTEDAFHLLESLPPLVSVVRYGNTRRTDSEAVLAVLDELVPRLCIGLPPACRHLDEEEARRVFGWLLQAHRAVFLLPRPEHGEAWLQALQAMTALEEVAPFLRGAAQRLLFDRRWLSLAATARRMAWALSPAWDPAVAGRWLEGFLHGPGLVLIHFPALWRLLDDWVASLDEGALRELLPVLRRAFAHFTSAERRLMLERAGRGATAPQTGPTAIDPERAAHLEDLLSWLLS